MKYLIIAGVVALVMVLLYSKLHPYLKMAGKILGTVRTIANSGSFTQQGGRSANKIDGKLVKCVSCGTWVPAERAIGVKPNLTRYCSRECLEKSSAAERRKAAS